MSAIYPGQSRIFWGYTHVSGLPSHNSIQTVPPCQRCQSLLIQRLVLRKFGNIVHAPHGRMRKLVVLVAFALDRIKLFRTRGLLDQSQRTLHIAQSLSQKGKFVVETSSRMIEGLVCYGQPFDLFGQDGVAVFTEERSVCCVEEFRVFVHYKGSGLALARAWSCADGHGHACGCCCPAGGVLFAGRLGRGGGIAVV